MLYANKQALRLIHKSTQCNKDCTGGKDLHIPIGNHVLFCDHPEGQNKIQDRYKLDVYVVVGHHQEPSVCYVQLLNKDKKDHPKVVNCCTRFSTLTILVCLLSLILQTVSLQ